jgi:hypothetical protein
MIVDMARFLSPEWLDLLAAAASARHDDEPSDAGGAPFAIRQVVTGGPDGDVEYAVRADAGRFSVHRAGEVHADVDIIQDYETATAISQGRLSPSVAFAAGRLKLGGGVGQLVEHHEEFAALGELFAQVRDATSY